MIYGQPFRLLVLAQPRGPHFAWLLHSLSLRRCETAAAFVEKKGRQYMAFALQAICGDKFGIDSRFKRCVRSCARAIVPIKLEGMM